MAKGELNPASLLPATTFPALGAGGASPVKKEPPRGGRGRDIAGGDCACTGVEEEVDSDSVKAFPGVRVPQPRRGHQALVPSV